MTILQFDNYLATHNDDEAVLNKEIIRKQLRRMVGFDMLIENKFRNNEQFGFIIANSSGHIIQLAPLYGNNTILNFFHPWYINCEVSSNYRISYDTDKKRSYAQQFTYGHSYHESCLENYNNGYMNELMFAMSMGTQFNKTKPVNIGLSREYMYPKGAWNKLDISSKCSAYVDWLEEIINVKLEKMRADI
jgi:hypothetical protein